MASDDKPPASPFDIIFKSYPHIAEQIVRNIPRHLRWNVAALNSDFYNMICEMDSKKHRIAIEGNSERYRQTPDRDSNRVLESHLMDSILNSGREIDELKIYCFNLNPQFLQQLIKIAEKFGKDIKRLHWDDCIIDLKRDIHLLIQFLQELPNLQELEVDDCEDCLNIPYENQIPSIAFKPVLKSLKSFKCGGGYSHIMSKFIAKDTLTEFHHECALLFDYAEFTRNQANLKSITFDYQSYQDDGEEMLDINDYKSLKFLEKFDLNQADEDLYDYIDGSKDLFVQQLIRDHPSLRELNFYHNQMKWNNTTLRTIGEHGKELEKLALIMDDVNCWSFLELRHLKQLKEIEIIIKEDYWDDDDDESGDDSDDESTISHALLQLSKLNMQAVKKFTLNIYRKIEFDPQKLLMNFGNHWSNIEKFECFLNFKSTATNPNVIDAILQNFTKLKSLKLDYSKKIDDGVIYPKLEKLKLIETDEASLLNMIKALPNLRKLEVSPWEKSDTEYNFPLVIQSILKLHKLKVVRLRIWIQSADVSSNDDFYDAIKNLCRRVPKFEVTFECEKVPEALDKYANYWSSRDGGFCKFHKGANRFSLESFYLRN